MNLRENVCKSGRIILSREIVGHWILNRVPVHPKDSLVIGKHATRDFSDVAHNICTNVISLLEV